MALFIYFVSTAANIKLTTTKPLATSLGLPIMRNKSMIVSNDSYCMLHATVGCVHASCMLTYSFN